MTGTPATPTTAATSVTPKTRAQLRPTFEQWHAVLAELRKEGDRPTQLGKALWSLYHRTETLLTEHMPCPTADCVTCRYVADTLTVFYAVDALWANDNADNSQKGGET